MRTLIGGVGVLALAVLWSTRVGAQPGAGPCDYKDIDIARYGYQDLRNPTESHAVGHRVRDTLTVQYTDPAKTTIAGSPVKLRGCNGQL